jgi:hypothetical protein
MPRNGLDPWIDSGETVSEYHFTKYSDIRVPCHAWAKEKYPILGIPALHNGLID